MGSLIYLTSTLVVEGALRLGRPASEVMGLEERGPVEMEWPWLKARGLLESLLTLEDAPAPESCFVLTLSWLS